MPPPPTLPDELLEEIFMRLPPDEPALLVRVSVASKHWRGVLTGPAFRTRYRDFHGAPSMLGFFYSWTPYDDGSENEGLFVSTSDFVACVPGEDEEDEDEDGDEYDYDDYSGLGRPVREREDGWNWEYHGHETWDCRHGRAVLGNRKELNPKLVVLDPVTGRWTELGVPKDYSSHGYPVTGRWTELGVPKDYSSHGAAVLCAVPGCHHRTCHEGPCKVVVVGMNLARGDSVAYAYVSYGEVEPASLPVEPAFHWSSSWV
jgi:hypothetical protein